MFCCFTNNVLEPRPFIPDTGYYTVIRVIDGDTIECSFKINKILYKTVFRIFGIDAPELHGKTEDERTMAKNSKEYLKNLIEGKKVLIYDIKNDKYGGRFVGTVRYNDIHIATHMISTKHAMPYYGKKKNEFNMSDYK